MPRLLGQEPAAWWALWCVSWLLVAGGMVGWRLAAGDDWRVALAAAALLTGLPGILGPTVSIPVQLDLPATGFALIGVALIELGHPAQIASGVGFIAIAAALRETSPMWAALWAWSPWPLVALVVPLVIGLLVKPGPDPLGEKFQRIADHPLRTALEHHAGRWRDGWLLVAPWGATLAALVGADWRLVVTLFAAHLLLLVATDTVRLVHHAAGPAMAAAAATVVPVEWLLVAVVLHVVWFRSPERV